MSPFRHPAAATILSVSLVASTIPAAADPTVSIAHDEVACLVAGLHPRMDACLAPPERVGRAQIQFRANGAGLWYAVDLAPGQSCLSALLPKPLATTRSVEYFVDVIDRSFGESRRPERAPDQPYQARVVARESDCHEMRKAGAFMMRSATPVTVMVVRDASGKALEAAAAQALGAPLPPGFSPEGVTVSTVQPSSGGAAAKAAAGAGTKAAGGGIGIGVLAGAGAAVVAGGVLLATKGGDGGSDGASTPSGPSLSGRWVGPTNRTITSNTTLVNTCTEEMTLDAQQTGTNLTGTLSTGTATCTASVPGLPPIVTNPPGGSAPIAGTVSGSQVQFSFTTTPNCPPATFTGSVSGTTLAGTIRYTCSTVTETTTWTAQRR
jgi:hypothetical protein